MSYLVFARKWRPQNFDQVIGQEHIATVLKNAISLKRVAHAYLFSGPRGIGKTSTARILAKALNCEKGPAPSPCNHCYLCQEISEGRSLDVIEIDGASNRGIEQIRQLRENVKFAPAAGRFKIYIIDEVHQITTDGFNALLKTLEEPPAHVKFIFATTQAHKVLPTILSRCQRFDFKPLTIPSIIEKLNRIIKEEKLDVSEEALIYIARAASGSMRDAESILDQMSSFCKERIELDMVTSILGTISLEALEEVAQGIIERKTVETLTLVEKIINEGKDLAQFMAGLMEHFRNILITKTVSSEKLGNFIDLPQDFISRISEQGKTLNFEEVFYIFNILMRAQQNLRMALSSRVIVEMAIVKLTQRENLSSLQAIMERLTQLEQNPGQPASPNLQKAGQLKSAPIRHNPSPGHNPAPRNNNESNDQPANEPVNPPAGKPVNPPVAEDLNQSWLRLLEVIKDEKMFVASVLEMAEVAGLKDGVLTVAFPRQYNFHQETLDEVENRRFIETKAKEIFGRSLKLEFIARQDTDEETAQARQEPKDPQNKIADQPVIQSAMKIFQGRIIRRASER
ncbi:MAG: DNA polymerase III subunit gamma/tau [Candidatus Omnitrophica bacterium]|nr:DNA polymerase III subunit gamma/tau [Candidatus Omnitrophota bacterium]